MLLHYLAETDTREASVALTQMYSCSLVKPFFSGALLTVHIFGIIALTSFTHPTLGLINILVCLLTADINLYRPLCFNQMFYFIEMQIILIFSIKKIFVNLLCK